MQARVDDAKELVSVIKDQDFERQFKEKSKGKRPQGFSWPEGLTIDDLVEFNKKILGQVWALQNPSVFQAGIKLDEHNFDLKNSSKNYLFIPLKLVTSLQDEPSFSYEIDFETVASFS